ncbi:MAG: hypothetical protein WCF90_09325 [Methanomicrobiales archaeon]
MLLFICIAAVFLSGCTSQIPPPVVPVTTSVPPTATLTLAQVDAQICKTDADCIPAPCCHPSSCVRETPRVCNAICTQSCEGPLDCGAGSCRCTNGRCSVVPALPTTHSIITKTSVTLTASPQRYTPIMSSTPGVGITVDANGFNKASSRFAWSATYGDFFSWGAVNYTVTEVGNPYTNDGGKLYWTFTQKPASTLEPVVITITATDAITGRMQGSSKLVLAWDGDNAVIVQN